MLFFTYTILLLYETQNSVFEFMLKIEMKDIWNCCHNAKIKIRCLSGVVCDWRIVFTLKASTEEYQEM